MVTVALFGIILIVSGWELFMYCNLKEVYLQLQKDKSYLKTDIDAWKQYQKSQKIKIISGRIIPKQVKKCIEL